MNGGKWIGEWGFLDASIGSLWPTVADIGNIAGRAAVMYAAGLLVVRFGKNRLLGRTTAFDIVLAFILGSLFSRGINGTAPLAGTVMAGVTLVSLHWLISSTSSRWAILDWLVKGPHRDLIRDGHVQEQAMRKAEVSTKDLQEALRLRAGVIRPEDVQLSCLERNGEISVVPKPPTPHVLEVEVAEGVQRIRIEL